MVNEAVLIELRQQWLEAFAPHTLLRRLLKGTPEGAVSPALSPARAGGSGVGASDLTCCVLRQRNVRAKVVGFGSFIAAEVAFTLPAAKREV